MMPYRMNARARRAILRAAGVKGPPGQPVAGADKAVRRLLARYDAPATALMSPSAPDTWEVATQLALTDEQTAREPIRFPASVMLVGMFPTVTPLLFNADAAVLTPQPEDLLVSVDIDMKDRVTANAGLSSTAGFRDATFVTLAALSVLLPRLHLLWLDTATPELGFTFRSKYATVGASGFPTAIRIHLALFAKPFGY